MKKKYYKEYEKFIKRKKLKRIIGIGAISVAAGLSANYLLNKGKNNKFTTCKETFDDNNDSNVYFVGGGLASLAGAAYLIRDCNFKGENIHIIQESKSLDKDNNIKSLVENVLMFRGRRVLNDKMYKNFWELLSSIPSLEYSSKSIKEHILNFDNASIKSKACLIDKYGDIVDISTMGFNSIDRIELLKLMMTSEDIIDEMTIEEWFNEHFFTTNFWYIWQNTFAFQKWSSLNDFKQHMYKMIVEFSNIERFEEVTRTAYNQYQDVIIPLKKYLEDCRVDFIVNSKVTDLEFKQGRGITVTAIHMEESKHDKENEITNTIEDTSYENNNDKSEKPENDTDNKEISSTNDETNDSHNEEENYAQEKQDDIIEKHEEKHESAIVSEVMKSLHITACEKDDEIETCKENKSNENIIYLNDNDKCIMINNNVIYNSAVGDFYTPPKYDNSKIMTSELFEKISLKKSGLECPQPFCDYTNNKLESFIITCNGNKLLKYIEEFSMNTPENGVIITFKDSNWLMTIVVDTQENLKNEPLDTTVIWGYGLYTDKTGNYINKSMTNCTGEDIIIELLYHLHLIDKKEEFLRDIINVIPHIIPYVDIDLNQMKINNLLEVVPRGSTNFAMINELVYMPEDIVVTEEYSVSYAKNAVYTLFNVDNKNTCPSIIHDKNPLMFIKALLESIK